MNKRSEELAQKAWEYADQNERKEDNHGILYRDKLIELVVQECVNICVDRHHTWRWDDEPYSLSGPIDCAQSIKQHFGMND